MHENFPRRDLLRLGATGVGALTLPVAAGATDPDTVHRLDDYDDAGNPVTDGPFVTRFTSAVSAPMNPLIPPDGTIDSTAFEWLDAGSPLADGDVALRLADRGGVDPNFRPGTPDDLTVAFDWRHAGGGSLAYAFNDRDSLSDGFRAFTNGIAGNGFVFRNPFGGRDIDYVGDLQDGAWHRLMVVLDGSANRFRAYVDGQLVGASFYDAGGWTATDTFRLMGRLSGSSTQVDYDRYVVVTDVLSPDAPVPAAPLIRYDIEAGRGTTLRNGRAGPGRELVAKKAAQIDAVRSTAAAVLPGPLAEGLDEEAEQLLADLAPSVGADGDPVAREAVDRMVLAEAVTSAGVAAGIEPAEETARTVGQMAFAIATLGAGKLLFRGTGRAGRWLASRLDYVKRQARRTLDDLVGGPTLPPSVRRDIDDRIERARLDVTAVMEDHTETLEEAGEAAASATLSEGLKRLPDEVIDALQSISEALESFFEVLLYSGYLLEREQVDENGERIQVPGIDRAIDDRMVELRQLFEEGALESAGRAGRVEERDASVDDLTDRGEDAASFLRLNRVTVGNLGLFSLLLVAIGLAAKSAAVAAAITGVGLGIAAGIASFGAYFITIGGAIGLFTAVLAGAGVLYGRGALSDLTKRHDAGISAIVMDGV